MISRELAIRSLRALWLLTAASLRRMMREGLVVRSMVWPGLVTVTTLSATLTIAAVVQPGRDVVVPPGIEVALRQELAGAGFNVWEDADPGARVRAGDASMGTDGHTLWIYGTPSAALEVEGLLRERADAPWRPVPVRPPAPRSEFARGDIVCAVLALLFVLYGLVFGLGGVARDRDDGTLEVELSLPIPRWVGGLARFIASTLILALFYTLSVGLLAAILPVPGFFAVIRNGIAAAGGGVSIGLAVVGTAGIKQGFSGPFAFGMTAATGLATSGVMLKWTWLPIASLFVVGGTGWDSLLVSFATGIAASALYGHRAGVG